MNIRYIQRLLILGFMLGIAKGFLESLDFQMTIKPRCYNRTQDHRRLINGQHIPLSNSMETFIELLDSFEKNYTSISQITMLELFLTRFRIDGIMEESEDVFRQRLLDADRLRLIKNILKPSVKLMNFPEEAFTEDEKCALYFMMSHTIVKDTERHLDPIPPDSTNLFEQGVVTLGNHPRHSIALGRVLLGILAGLKGSQDRSIKDILEAIDKDKFSETVRNTFQLEGDIDILYGVTIGDTIAAEVLRTVNETYDRTTRKFGPNGTWNSTICPTAYRLHRSATRATYGEIRGAGDGFILGLQARELRKKNVNVPISTLLRMYYSERGIPGTTTYSFCKRWENWGEFTDKARSQIHYYSRLMNMYSNSGSLHDSKLDEGSKKALDEFENSRDDLVGSQIQNPEDCFSLDTDINPSCETPSDVFIVLDTRGNKPEIWQKQKAIVTSLAAGLDLRYYGGRLNVFTNVRGPGDRVLENIVVNATSAGSIGCKLDSYYSGYSSSVDETYVLESLYKLLTNYETDRSHSPGIPGKTIIYFNYATSIKEDYNLRRAYWDIKDKHRDVKIFSIGSERRVLEKLATDGEKIILDDSPTDPITDIVNDLKAGICTSPGILQYDECNKQPSRLDEFETFTGYVTPRRIQYWSMYPEFFLKSYDIKFVFTAIGGNIKVCHSRNNRWNSNRCTEVTSADPEHEVYISNPCRRKTVYNCDPFHFSIEGKETGINDPKCFDKECKSFDQIKFTIKHEGISCNGATQLLSSFILLALSLFYLMKMN